MAVSLGSWRHVTLPLAGLQPEGPGQEAFVVTAEIAEILFDRRMGEWYYDLNISNTPCPCALWYATGSSGAFPDPVGLCGKDAE
jgi:hypothetical protein